jgi:hypothetical protein
VKYFWMSMACLNVGRIGEEAVFKFRSSANAQQPIKDKQFIIYSSAAFLPIRCYGQGGKIKATWECICMCLNRTEQQKGK